MTILRAGARVQKKSAPPVHWRGGTRCANPRWPGHPALHCAFANPSARASGQPDASATRSAHTHVAADALCPTMIPSQILPRIRAHHFGVAYRALECVCAIVLCCTGGEPNFKICCQESRQLVSKVQHSSVVVHVCAHVHVSFHCMSGRLLLRAPVLRHLFMIGSWSCESGG